MSENCLVAQTQIEARHAVNLQRIHKLNNCQIGTPSAKRWEGESDYPRTAWKLIQPNDVGRPDLAVPRFIGASPDESLRPRLCSSVSPKQPATTFAPACAKTSSATAALRMIAPNSEGGEKNPECRVRRVFAPCSRRRNLGSVHTFPHPGCAGFSAQTLPIGSKKDATERHKTTRARAYS